MYKNQLPEDETSDTEPSVDSPEGEDEGKVPEVEEEVEEATEEE